MRVISVPGMLFWFIKQLEELVLANAREAAIPVVHSKAPQLILFFFFLALCNANFDFHVGNA